MAKRKRGRPPKMEDAQGPGIAEAVHPYQEEYAGRRWWLMGIKVDEERQQLPCHSHVCGGINWQQGTQRQTETDGWMGLDDHRRRVVPTLYQWSQVSRAIGEVKEFVVRWRRHVYQTPGGAKEGWATDIICLINRYKVKVDATKTFQGGAFRYQPSKLDVPLSKYLVLVPRTYIAGKTRGFMPEIRDLPTMFDLDSTLVSERLIATQQQEYGEDEPW